MACLAGLLALTVSVSGPRGTSCGSRRMRTVPRREHGVWYGGARGPRGLCQIQAEARSNKDADAKGVRGADCQPKNGIDWSVVGNNPDVLAVTTRILGVRLLQSRRPRRVWLWWRCPKGCGG